MRIGLILPHWTGSMGGDTPDAGSVIEFAKKAEETGFDGLWLTDHVYHEPYLDFLEHGYELPEQMKGVRSGFWDAWSLLPALAEATEDAEIGTLVTNTAFRNPALLANMAETVDSLSDGRLTLGLGAGDFRSEHDFLGFAWERRVGRFENALQIITPMLGGKRVSYDGEYYSARDAEILPKGPRSDGPPVLIGMMRLGPRMQRLAVEYGDGWSCWLAFGDSWAGDYAERVTVMREACERRGRDPASLRNTVTVGVTAPGSPGLVPGANPIAGTEDQVVEELLRYRDSGADHLSIYLEPCNEQGLEWFAGILDQIGSDVTPL
jgi:alkanesulfonate monooxygenase SsuD/methylene tetrahydromethanopterin reductase-like flavin-dependent oxidoreductase (luciferase family)